MKIKTSSRIIVIKYQQQNVKDILKADYLS